MTEGRESETEHDCRMNAYWRTYGSVNETANEGNYSNANETTGTSNYPPATRRRTPSPPSLSGGYGDPRPCAALRK